MRARTVAFLGLVSAISAPALALLTTGGGFTDPVVTNRLLEALRGLQIVRLEAQHWIPTEQPEAMRKAIALTKNFDGINGKWSFDANGDVDYDTMAGFKVTKADTPVGCKFQFESILE